MAYLIHKTAMQTKKSLGQHFLRCKWVLDTLIAAADLSGADTVLEIGPGTGILTRALARRAKTVLAVEKDETLADALADALKQEEIHNVHIVKGDILRLTQTKFRSESDLNLVWVNKIGHNGFKVVANIPYYLTSRLLRLLLQQEPRPERIVLTIQKEVAERITAAPPRMNLLALSVQAYGAPQIIKTVPASCFAPPPEVESAIIAITGISDNFFRKNSVDAAMFFKVARAAFGQKRKQIVNPLAAIAGGKQKALVAIIAAGLDPRVRPQELSLDQWVALVKNSSRP